MMSSQVAALLAVSVLVNSPASAQIQNQEDDGQWVMPAKTFASTLKEQT
jgi:hypothetical protein